MEYRILPHGGERISVIGLGTSSLGEADEQEVIETVRMALDHGINYIDMARKAICAPCRKTASSTPSWS